jgi:act minimal PKS acyl carrier protein
MNPITIDDLILHLRAAVGDDESIQLNPDLAHTPLNDLGIDSLAVIDATNRIERQLDVALPDGSLTEAETMRQLCDSINAQLRTGV